MRKINLIFIFLGLLFLDGVVLPGMFGFRDGTLVLVFLLAMILNWGASASVLWLGSGFSLFLEFFWRIQLGSFILLFLTAVLLYFIVSSSLSIKRYIGAGILSFVLPYAVFGGWGGLVIIITGFAGFLLCFFLFDNICSERKNIKFL